MYCTDLHCVFGSPFPLLEMMRKVARNEREILTHFRLWIFAEMDLLEYIVL